MLNQFGTSLTEFNFNTSFNSVPFSPFLLLLPLFIPFSFPICIISQYFYPTLPFIMPSNRLVSWTSVPEFSIWTTNSMALNSFFTLRLPLKSVLSSLWSPNFGKYHQLLLIFPARNIGAFVSLATKCPSNLFLVLYSLHHYLSLFFT